MGNIKKWQPNHQPALVWGKASLGVDQKKTRTLTESDQSDQHGLKKGGWKSRGVWKTYGEIHGLNIFRQEHESCQACNKHEQTLLETINIHKVWLIKNWNQRKNIYSMMPVKQPGGRPPSGFPLRSGKARPGFRCFPQAVFQRGDTNGNCQENMRGNLWIPLPGFGRKAFSLRIYRTPPYKFNCSNKPEKKHVNA